MIKTEPIQVYRIYLGVKLHFSDKDFNYVKANGGVRVSSDALSKRRDRYHFEKLSETYNQRELLGYFVSNFVYGSQNGAIIDQESGYKVYSSWRAKLERLTYLVGSEVDGVLDSNDPDSFNSLFRIDNGSHPSLLKKYLGGDISLETMLILDKVVDYLEDWRNHIREEYVWPETYKLMVRYSDFINFDNTKKYKQEILRILR